MSLLTAPNEFIEAHVRAKRGLALIVGSKVYNGKPDRRKCYPNAIGVDLEPGDGVDVVADLEDEAACLRLGTFAHIECMSVLEHVKRPWIVADHLERMLEPKGTIYIAVPFIWRFHGYPSDYWRFTTEGIRLLFPRIAWSVAKYVHEKATEAVDIPCVKHNDSPHFCRCEVMMFGSR